MPKTPHTVGHRRFSVAAAAGTEVAAVAGSGAGTETGTGTGSSARARAQARRGRVVSPLVKARRDQQRAMIRARRRAAMAPLFAWLEEHHYRVNSVLARAAQRAGEPPMSRGRITQIKQGILPIPLWMVEQTCAELEESMLPVPIWLVDQSQSALEASIVRVMGANWLAEYGAEYAAETYARWRAVRDRAAS